MNVTQVNTVPYKKTSIRVGDMSPKTPKADLFNFQKKPSVAQMHTLTPSQNSQYCNNILPNINTILSTSNISTVSMYGAQDLIRRIAKQEAMTVYQQFNRSNNKIQGDIQKIQQNLDSLWKATKIALQENSSQIQKETSEKFQIILGGMKKAMFQIQKQIKNDVIQQVTSLPSFHNSTFTDITQKVNKISDHVFRAPYQRQKRLQIVNQVKEISKQVEVFSQCNMTLFTQLNKIKNIVNILSSQKNLTVSNVSTDSPLKTVRPLSSASCNLQFKRPPRNKMSQRSNSNVEQLQISPNRSFENLPTISNISSVIQPQPKIHDEVMQGPLTYQVDSQGRLQDSSGDYLLNDEGQHVLVKQEHMDALRKFNMLIQ